MRLPSLIALATSNPGKLAEVRAMLAGVEVVAAGDVVPGWTVVEDGDTFEANARVKAEDLAVCAALPALGDDSGLEVAALGGRPGVRSARYAGHGASDAANVARVLEEMRAVPEAARAAAFHCALALVWPDGASVEATGRCEGTIAHAPRGCGGFGYDAVFIDPATGLTFAELPREVKNERSHRRRALDALRAQLSP